MVMERLLVCVDGSKYSEEAVRYAVEIWRKYNSSITLIFVWHPPAASGQGIVIRDIPDYEIAKLTEAEKILKDAGITYTVIKKIGNPAMHIIDESKKGYDLVVMGSRGLGSVEGFLLGSVTSRVTHHVRVPILIVPPKG
ncbi:MAG: Universal stress protein family protein [Methanomassiliicoccales archaeon PtaU1.Bin030]|nr:MAG: Universal stress protein family protein [Methanomassiliicoccales archaeon PtaU1.Bin030]